MTSFSFSLLVSVFASLTPAFSLANTCLYLPNIHLIGGTYDEFQANDIKECCIRCAESHCCMGYSYNVIQRRCYMKSAITTSEENDAHNSGLKSNSYSGQGSTLRNVKIEGGRASNVELDSPDDCLQYCTAYGIYSWTPPRLEEDQPAQCTCMARILSLRYYYGAKSEIFPVSDINF